MKKRFRAFISYSQQDKKETKRLHRALERYRVPRGIFQTSTSKRRLGRFFLDELEMGATGNLSATIKGAIDDSENMIVMCSTHSATSKWVDSEIAHFKQENPTENILAVIIDGDPNSENPEKECFPPAFRCGVETKGMVHSGHSEPRASDIRKASFRKVIVEVVSGLLNIPFDDLWHRDRRRYRRTITISVILGIFFCATVALGVLSIWEAQIQKFRAESIDFSRKSQDAADAGDAENSLRLALKALPVDKHPLLRLPRLPEAISSLRRAMSIQSGNILVQYDLPLRDLRFAAGGIIAAELDNDEISLINPETGSDSGRINKVGIEKLRSVWTSGLKVEGLRNHGELLFKMDVYEDYKTDSDESIFDLTLTTWAVRERTRIETHSFKVFDWLPLDASVSPSGRFLAMQSLKPPVRIGLFDWRNTKDGATLIPSKVAIIPDIDSKDSFRYAFADETTIAYSWSADSAGGNRKGIGLWRIKSEKSVTLVHPDEEPICTGAPSSDVIELKNTKASVAMAHDRSVIAIERPKAGVGWCIDRWSLPAGEALPSILIRRTDTGGIAPFSRDWLMVYKAHDALLENSLLFDSAGISYELEGCEGRMFDPLETINLGPKIVVDTHKDYLACVSDSNKILEFSPLSGGIGVPLGHHKGSVNALAYNSERDMLISVGSDGKLMHWRNNSKIHPIRSTSKAIRITCAFSRIAVLFDDGTVGVYSGVGELLSPPIPVRRDYHFHAILAAGGETLLVFTGEKYRLFRPVDDPKPAPPKNMASLYRVSDGELLAEIDRLALDDFLAHLPADVAFNRERGKCLFRLNSGDAVEFDILTGKELRRLSVKEGQIVDVAYYEDSGIWLLVSDGAPEPINRRIMLIFEDEKGNRKEVMKQRARSGRLYSSPNNRAMAVGLNANYLSPGNSIILRAFYGPNRQLSLPNIDYIPSTVLFGRDDEEIILLNKSNPLLIFDTRNKETQTVLPELEAYATDTWRVNDPLRRVFASIDDNALTIVPLDGVGVCFSLNGLNANAAAFSLDGRYLAISDDDETTVYDLLSCTPVIKLTDRVLNNEDIVFADDEHLWLILNDRIAVVALDSDVEELITKARDIAATATFNLNRN